MVPCFYADSNPHAYKVLLGLLDCAARVRVDLPQRETLQAWHQEGFVGLSLWRPVANAYDS